MASFPTQSAPYPKFGDFRDVQLNSLDSLPLEGYIMTRDQGGLASHGLQLPDSSPRELQVTSGSGGQLVGELVGRPMVAVPILVQGRFG